MLTVFARDEFAAARRGVLDHAEAELAKAVDDALAHIGEHGWYDHLLNVVVPSIFSEVFHDETGENSHPNLGDAELNLHEILVRTLSLTGTPDVHTAEAVTRLLATATVNAATAFAASVDETDLVLEWVDMHDSHVRETHHAANGQRQLPGTPFEVGGAKLEYPGDARAPIEEWINCRCVLRPDHALTSLAAAAMPQEDMPEGTPEDAPEEDPEEKKSYPSVVVALPKKGHPIHDAGDETDKHTTLAYLGDSANIPDNHMGAIHDAVASSAKLMRPFNDKVSGTAILGKDKAKVALMDGHGLTEARNSLLAHPPIEDAVRHADSFPNFIPHVTLSYDDSDEDVPLGDVKDVDFDRLAVWHGGKQTEYPMGGGGMTAAVSADDAPIPWHGVLAPVDTWSGDKRRFKSGSLRNRELPLPLTWQKMSNEGHKQSVVVARIDNIDYVDGAPHGSGVFMRSPEADELIGQMAEFDGKFGVSVDVDDSSFEVEEAASEGERPGVTFTDARICSASVVAIPAFAEAYVALGPWPDAEAPAEAAAIVPVVVFGDIDAVEFISDKSWDGSAGRFTPEQWKASCILHLSDTLNKSDHKLPIKEPGGELSRAGVHAAAGRLNQTDAPPDKIASAKSALRGAYRQLGEEPPFADEVLTLAEAIEEQFGRGPGWLTNPVPTERIHAYWTVPGHAGFEKIGWGTPHDFYRCREQVGEEIGEGSPEKLRFINQICAQWHHDALGYWPNAKGEKRREMSDENVQSVSLVAAGGWLPPVSWFADPKLDTLTAIKVEKVGDQYRCYGHLADWTACHLDFPGVCTAPPRTLTNYADFLLGSLETDEGLIAIGNLTLGAGHARDGLGMRAALAHYDSTATVVADVNVGEDDHGIWFAGWMRNTPDIEERIRELRASKLSGDWRYDANVGNMEMIAAHGVNSPGYRVPQAVGMRDGRQVSLIASIHAEPEEPTVVTHNTVNGGGGTSIGTVTVSLVADVESLTDDVLDKLVNQLAERQDRQRRAEELRNRYIKERQLELASALED